MATLMLENGADIRYIQAILGHENLETSEIFTHVSIRKLKEIHTAAHPAKLHRDTVDHEDEDKHIAAEKLFFSLVAEAEEDEFAT